MTDEKKIYHSPRTCQRQTNKTRIDPKSTNKTKPRILHDETQNQQLRKYETKKSLWILTTTKLDTATQLLGENHPTQSLPENKTL